jgi:hypothetical protein
MNGVNFEINGRFFEIEERRLLFYLYEGRFGNRKELGCFNLKEEALINILRILEEEI